MTTKVHQALHGYSEGHRQLASSLQLGPKDTKLLLVMSDVSGPGVTSEGTSYVTGYPLPEAGVYAIAKTWPALEMPRPGSVWTHTLFISFADLARLSEPSQIASYFKRPELEDSHAYGQPISIDFDEVRDDKKLDEDELAWLKQVLYALYGAPRERILARRLPSLDADRLVFKCWDQQWPRLRRTFRFCTLTSKDRSSEGATFDLQIASTGGLSSRTRLLGTLDVSDVVAFPSDEWLQGLVADIDRPNVTGLRDFLRLLGADILGGREEMRPLCQFHNVVNESLEEGAIDDAISFVSKVPSVAGSAFAKALVANAAMRHSRSLSEPAMRFLLGHVSLVDDALVVSTKEDLGRALWEGHPDLLFELLDGVSELRPLAFQIVEGIPVENLLRHWPVNQDAQNKILQIRPDVLAEPAFWAATEAWPRALNGLEAESRDRVASAMVQGIRDENLIVAATAAIGEFNTLQTLDALVTTGVNVECIEAWVRATCGSSSAIMKFLSESETPSACVLQHIADEMSPDAVPNAGGQDPWYLALSRLQQRKRALPLPLCVYGFVRALGRSSRNTEGLLQLTFEPVHDATRDSQLRDGDWRVIENCLPWVSADIRRNRCLHLRQAVASAYLGRYLWAGAFPWLVESDHLLQLVMIEVIEQWRGRRFLREAHESLRNRRDDLGLGRRQLIDRFLKTHERTR